MSNAPSMAIQEIIQGLEALDSDPVTKQKFRQLVRAVGAAHGISWIEREDRVSFARELLDLRVSRPTIRDRLIATFEVSRPQAYRIIDSALQLSQKRLVNETPHECNDHID